METAKITTTPTTYDPLSDAAPNVKEYQKPNVDVSNIPEELPTHQFQRPTMSFEPTGEFEKSEETTTTSSTKETQQSFNQSYQELGKKDKRIGAENMAATAIGGYDFLCSQLMAPMVKIKPNKIEEKISTGEISADIKLVLDEEGNEGNVRDYVSIFNTNIDEIFGISDSFVQEVREPLIRIAERRGLALTDEQAVGIAFGKDLLTKGLAIFQLKSGQALIIENLIEQTKQLKFNASKIPPSNFEDVAMQKNNPVVEKANPTIIPTIVEATAEIKDDALHIYATDKTFKPEVKGSNFVQSEKPKNIKKFGNKDILAHMDQEFGDKPKTPRKATPKASTTKKVVSNTPKNKKVEATKGKDSQTANS